MEITSQIIHYVDLKDNEEFVGDDYGIVAYATTKAKREAFLANPFLGNKDQCFLYLMKVNDTFAGRSILYPTRIKIGNDVFAAQCGSSLEVVEKFRKLELGVDLTTYPVFNKQFDFILYSGLSKYAIPIYKVLRFSFIESTLLWQPRTTRFLFEKSGFPSFLTNIFAPLATLLLFPILYFEKLVSANLFKKYQVEKLTTIPEWVNDMVLNDGHKYMELHNRDWLQWNLDYNHYGGNDSQAFYAIYKTEKPIGFFMITERFKNNPSKNISNLGFGSVIEWATIDNNVLSEYDIHWMAMSFFSKNVDIIQVASNCKSFIKRMKHLFFFEHGKAYIVFKDLRKKYKDSANNDLWRVRLGYADTIFY